MDRARAAAAAGLVALSVGGPAQAQEAASGRADWTLQLEGGSEYDSNVHREEEGEEENRVVGSPAARLGARHRLSWRRTGRERLLLSGHAGLKLFTTDEGRRENVAVLSSEGSYEWGLPERDLVLGLTGNYYDAIPYLREGGTASEGRTFRAVSGEAAGTLVGPSGHRFTGLAGYRLFTYKPDPNLDWRGEHVGLFYQATFWRGDPDRDLDAASIDLMAGYRIERRGYEGGARTRICPDPDEPDPACSGPAGLPRADLNHSLAAELVYTGQRVYSARYELQVNDSNSFGESLVRQRLRLAVTAELFRDLYATAEATALVHIYLDPLLVVRDDQALTYLSIDEENRNSLSLHLSRPLAASWSIEGRYAIFSNEFTNQELTFRRQTLYLGAVYRYEH